jgi:uncharacterized protein with NRDE domain
VCLITFAWQAHADYPLVVAANRDEFFARPTSSADWSSDGERLSGRDLRGGGTWMGVSRDGRFAALTNYRDPASYRADAPSRGELVDRFLTAADATGALDEIAHDNARFNGFNLLAARWNDDPVMSIVSHPAQNSVTTIAPGIHGLSNAHLDTAWPKVEAVTSGLHDALSAAPLDQDALIEGLFDLLSDRSITPDELLPKTGVPLEFERALSATFIRMPGYGTRSTTVLLVDRAGFATFVERRFEPDVPVEERRFVFETAPPVATRPSAARAS